MLLQRVLTAVVLVPLSVLALYFLPVAAFALLFAVLALLGAYEWSALMRWEHPAIRYAYLAGIAVVMLFGWLYPQLIEFYILIGSIVWFFVAIALIRYRQEQGVLSMGAVRVVLGVIVLASAWAALVDLRAAPHGSHWLMILFVIIWLSDIGAYFAGRQFGTRRLAPEISPGKTWEGFAGGLLAGVIGAGVVWAVFRGSGMPVWLVAAAALLIVWGVFGDLLESVVKRLAHVKDSGALLPGHGGVLDRIDSLLAALPLAALLVQSVSWA